MDGAPRPSVLRDPVQCKCSGPFLPLSSSLESPLPLERPPSTYRVQSSEGCEGRCLARRLPAVGGTWVQEKACPQAEGRGARQTLSTSLGCVLEKPPVAGVTSACVRGAMWLVSTATTAAREQGSPVFPEKQEI